jgi:excisionase family DNA binding protein
LDAKTLAIMDQALTVQDVARLLRVSSRTVYLLARRGRIAAFKMGNNWYFSSEAVEEFMRSVTPIDGDPDNPDRGHGLATSVTIVELRYRAPCSEPSCQNPGCMILRHADVNGAPMTSREFCLKHGRERVERDRAAGVCNALILSQATL